MLVRDHMSHRVVSVEPQRSAAEVRTLLRRHRIRQVPVLRKGRLVGIVTDRDLRGVREPGRKVAEVMTAKPFVISPSASVDEAARLMRTYKIGALPVVDDGELIGILTGSDILDAFVELSGVSGLTYRLTIGAKDGKQAEPTVRRIIEEHKGELKWLHREPRGRHPQIHARLRARHVEDVVTALEAAGFEVTSVVAPGRKP
jgi:acetoin utilization protein AcuB